MAKTIQMSSNNNNRYWKLNILQRKTYSSGISAIFGINISYEYVYDPVNVFILCSRYEIQTKLENHGDGVRRW